MAGAPDVLPSCLICEPCGARWGGFGVAGWLLAWPAVCFWKREMLRRLQHVHPGQNMDDNAETDGAAVTLQTRRDRLLECSQALGHGNPAAKYGVHARSSRFSPVLPIILCRHSGHALRPLPLRRPVDAGTQAQGSQRVRPALTAGAATWVLGHNLRLLGYSLRPA